MYSIDEIDIKILEILQKNGRTRRNELAELVGLSIPSVSERMRKLEENKYISGYHAVLNSKLLGKDITAFILVTVDSSKHYNSFKDHTSSVDEIFGSTRDNRKRNSSFKNQNRKYFNS